MQRQDGKCVSSSHHVVPKSASHEGVSLLAEMEAVGGEEGAIGAAVLPSGEKSG